MREQEPKYLFDRGRVINRASGDAIPLDEPVMIFRGRDRYAAAIVCHYLTLVHDPEHRKAVGARLQDFSRFAAEHPERMKEPDTVLAPDHD